MTAATVEQATRIVANAARADLTRARGRTIPRSLAGEDVTQLHQDLSDRLALSDRQLAQQVLRDDPKPFPLVFLTLCMLDHLAENSREVLRTAAGGELHSTIEGVVGRRRAAARQQPRTEPPRPPDVVVHDARRYPRGGQP